MGVSKYRGREEKTKEKDSICGKATKGIAWREKQDTTNNKPITQVE